VRGGVSLDSMRRTRWCGPSSYSRPGYSTRCWTEAEAILRPRVAEPLLERVLVEYDLPMAIGDDPDVVLTEALGFLRDGLRAE
jgi:hypothetical protein